MAAARTGASVRRVWLLNFPRRPLRFAEALFSGMKLLHCADIHLGYGEKHAEKALDSFITFEEILQIAKEKEVDFVLLGRN